MKVIHNKNQKHTLQFENFKKKGFKYLEYSEYLNLEKKLHDMIESGQFSELSAMEIADKEYGKIKYELVTHNLQLLKKNKDLNIPIYFFSWVFISAIFCSDRYILVLRSSYKLII